MENDFDPDWPHGHLSGGHPARIVCRDAKGDYPIVAMVLVDDGVEVPYSYTGEGHMYDFTETPEEGLRNAPAPKKRLTGWMNIYPHGAGGIHFTKDDAHSVASIDRIACIYIDVEEG